MDEDIAVKESSSLLVPVLISGVVGAGLALLFTPKSGREIRQNLKRFASSTGEQASEAMESGMEKGKDIYQAGRSAATQAVETAKSSLALGQEQLAEASDGQRSLVVPILVSGVVGAAIALLFAPKSGSEVMGDIKDIASSALDKSKGWYEQGAAAVKEAIEKGKQTAAETKEQLRPAA